MFSSRNKKAYQKIDDDFDDSPLDFNTCTNSLVNTVNAGRNMIFGGNAGEQQSLIPGPSSNVYQDSPTHRTEEPANNFTYAGPPTMATSGQMSSQRWDHIENPDQFFTHIYEYHQNGGFLCILLLKIFRLLQFLFIIAFSTFFTQCIDYDILFANKNPINPGKPIIGKRHFSDAVIGDCLGQLNWTVVVALFAAVIYWITRLVKHANYILQMHQIRAFYEHELKINDQQLANLTWHAVVKRICEVQPRLHLMIHTERMTAIDVYHRILRYKNYIVGMVNQRVLKPVFNVPFLGQMAYLPNELETRIERLLFYSTTAPWDGPNLREDYKHDEMLDALTKKLENDCAFYGLLYLLLMPVMLPYQILVSFFSLTDLIKRRPDGLGMRKYSNYGRYRVRHFNELKHELAARLNRSHIYAAAYMDQFFSPVIEIVAKNVAFVAAAIAVALSVLSAWDEDVLQVEHVLTVISVCGVIIVICRGMIPDENLVWQPEVLMTHVASELHYLPPEWKGQAHTDAVRNEFDQVFQMKWMYYVLELSSPIVTPFLLLFWLRPKCGELIRFLHDYTVRVEGLGDICSFALMDIARHGDPHWNAIAAKEGEQPDAGDAGLAVSHDRALDGKTELSVLHFKTTNPEWQPPRATAKFLDRFRNRLGREAAMLTQVPLAALTSPQQSVSQSTTSVKRNLLQESLHSMMPVGTTIRNAAPGRHPLMENSSGEGLHRIDGPLENAFVPAANQPQGGVIASLYQQQPQAAESLTQSLKASGVDVDGAGAEMRIQALFLRGLHEESRIIQSRFTGYGASMVAQQNMQCVFAMPEGLGRRPEESLIDVEPGTSVAQFGGIGAISGLETSSQVPRSRLVTRTETADEIGQPWSPNQRRHEELTEEDEDQDDDERPPEFFRSQSPERGHGSPR